MMANAAQRLCFVHFDSWAGRFKVRAEVIRECVRKGKPHYQVRLLESAMRHSEGKILYPPKASVTFKE